MNWRHAWAATWTAIAISYVFVAQYLHAEGPVWLQSAVLYRNMAGTLKVSDFNPVLLASAMLFGVFCIGVASMPWWSNHDDRGSARPS